MLTVFTLAPGSSEPSEPMLHLSLDPDGKLHRLGAVERLHPASASVASDANGPPAAPTSEQDRGAVLQDHPSPAPAVQLDRETSGRALEQVIQPVSSAAEKPVRMPARAVEDAKAEQPSQQLVQRAPAIQGRPEPDEPVRRDTNRLSRSANAAPEAAAELGRPAATGSVEPLTTHGLARSDDARGAARRDAGVQLAPSAPIRQARLQSDTIPQGVTPPPDPERSRTARAPTDDRLVQRAEQLIREGDLSGARSFLERALSADNGRAAFLLAQTYDPRNLRAWNVHGMRGDPDRALELYAAARQAGYTAGP